MTTNFSLTWKRFSLLIVAGVLAASSMFVNAGNNTDEKAIAEGKEISFDRKKGNCLACHMVDDGSLPGNVAPPLIAMKARYPDFNKLKEQIENPLIANPNSMMPPFGLHNILTEDELTKVAQYIYSL